MGLDLAFRSGMSNLSDMRGAVNAGVPIGVVAGNLTTAALVLTLPRYCSHGGKVFIDSGAFTSRQPGEEMDWAEILSRYKTVASLSDCPENLFVVAPDCVGDQEQSLLLLTAWAPRVRELIATGCQVIIPIQVGSLPGQAMIERVSTLLGSRRFIVGIPSNRAAMSVAECKTLRHPAFHILGRVQCDDQQAERLAALCQGNPGASITADANWLRSRIKLVQARTSAEHDRRRSMRIGAGSTEICIDHPRAIAVEDALRAEKFWGKTAPA